MVLRNFVVFEGGDGTGTSTQLSLLKQRTDLLRDGPQFFFTFEPTDGPIGQLIRRSLHGDPPLQAETIARLFAADRNEHLYGKGGIVELCEKNNVVISDRYVLSSLVYQGLVCKSDLPDRLNADFPYPELVLYFDIPAEKADQRLANREKKDAYEKLDFQIQVHRRYGELLPRYTAQGSRLVRINAALSIEEVAQEVWRALQNLPILGG